MWFYCFSCKDLQRWSACVLPPRGSTWWQPSSGPFWHQQNCLLCHLDTFPCCFSGHFGHFWTLIWIADDCRLSKIIQRFSSRTLLAVAKLERQLKQMKTYENEITVLYPFVPTVLFMGIPSNWFKDATSALVMHLGRIRQMFRIDASKRLCRPRLICSILCCVHHCCQRLGAAYSSMCHHSWTWSRSLKSFEKVSSVSRVSSLSMSFKSVSSIMYSLRCNVRVTSVSCRMLFRFLQALEHLHERRIVHRTDLRAATKSDFPANGLVYERYWRNRTM